MPLLLEPLDRGVAFSSRLGDDDRFQWMGVVALSGPHSLVAVCGQAVQFSQ